MRLDLHASTTVRSDADGGWLYTGPHPQRRGARRTDAGQVNCQAWSRFEALGPRADEPHRHVYTAVVWHKTLKRRLRLVGLRNRQAPAKPRVIVLGSTAPELKGHTRRDRYAARCQSELLFRDRKQCTGLLDGQARAAAAFACHFTASLATRNLVRAEDLRLQQGQAPHVCSMASWKPYQCNER